jgi:fumarylpyruvate hydrolase
MGHAIPLWSPPSLPVAGTSDSFPVRRIFCVGRNYAEHQKEMGGDGREQPFFFIKSAHALVPNGGEVRYPAKTSNYHYETELVVALAKGGRRIDAKRANDYVFGYAVGLDMTRRDLQMKMREQGRPWEIGKAFDFSAPIGPVRKLADAGEISSGAISLEVNGETRQKSDIRNLIWSVNEVIANLSTLFALQPGDLIFTGTPEGVGAVAPGDLLQARIAGVGTLDVRIEG